MTNLQAVLKSIQHWKNNVECATKGWSYQRCCLSCACCTEYLSNECWGCPLSEYGYACDMFPSPWEETSNYSINPTWNMLTLLMLIYLSEGGDPKKI